MLARCRATGLTVVDSDTCDVVGDVARIRLADCRCEQWPCDVAREVGVRENSDDSDDGRLGGLRLERR